MTATRFFFPESLSNHPTVLRDSELESEADRVRDQYPDNSIIGRALFCACRLPEVGGALNR